MVGDYESDWSKSLLMLTSRREVLIGRHCLDCVLRPVDVGSLLLFIRERWGGALFCLVISDSHFLRYGK